MNFSDESLFVDLDDENEDDNSFLSSWPLKDQKLKRILTQAHGEFPLLNPLRIE